MAAPGGHGKERRLVVGRSEFMRWVLVGLSAFGPNRVGTDAPPMTGTGRQRSVRCGARHPEKRASGSGPPAGGFRPNHAIRVQSRLCREQTFVRQFRPWLISVPVRRQTLRFRSLQMGSPLVSEPLDHQAQQLPHSGLSPRIAVVAHEGVPPWWRPVDVESDDIGRHVAERARQNRKASAIGA